ncbi:MAG TPA: alpha/beta hydrolase [Magnetospirillum sp.]|nr:alpha/beta hydrolase [Magnetospirillum sp.]
MISTEILARTRNFQEMHKVAISGQGTTTVVLANGFGTDQTMWNRILPWLERRYRVIRFDWLIDPHHYDCSRYATLNGFADDLQALLITTDASPCLYIGHSMSGMIGMLAAKRAPERFRSMVMVAPSPCYVNRPGYHGGFEPAQIEQLLHDLGGDYMNWVNNFSPLAVAAPPDHPEVAEFTRSLLAMRPDVAFSMALSVFKMDMRDQLGGFDIPTTIVQTRHDLAVPAAVAEYLHAHWPQSRIEFIDASGHFPHMTAAPQLIDILARVLPAQ